MQVAHSPGALDLIVSALQFYTQGTVAEGAPGAAAGGRQPSGKDKAVPGASREDCMVKLLRLVANLAINPQVWWCLSELARRGPPRARE